MYPSQLESVRVGETTKEEVRNLLGNPKDLQVSSDQGHSHESWAYARADPFIHPLQYVPILGVLALAQDQSEYAFSISFSPEGLVESVGIQEVQPYGEERVPASTIVAGSPVQSYGTNNPLTHHSKQSILR